MALQFGDVQETALITLAIRASETAREKPRIVDMKAKEIIDSLGVDVSKFDPFLSHEGVVARTILFRNTLKDLLRLLNYITDTYTYLTAARTFQLLHKRRSQ